MYIGDALARRLLMIARPKASRSLGTSRSRPGAKSAAPCASQTQCRNPGEPIVIATVGAEGVLDTGASRTVVGSDRVKGILANLSQVPTESQEGQL